MSSSFRRMMLNKWLIAFYWTPGIISGILVLSSVYLSMFANSDLQALVNLGLALIIWKMGTEVASYVQFYQQCSQRDDLAKELEKFAVGSESKIHVIEIDDEDDFDETDRKISRKDLH